jgi:hypothetical protein
LVGYGALEVPMIEVNPPETLEECDLDLLRVDSVDSERRDETDPVGPTATVEFDEYGGLVKVPIPEDVVL